jgi:hypothetical protein
MQKKFTVEDLREGKCAAINDGTLEELNKVLKIAWPDDVIAQGNAKFYEKGNIGWACSNGTSLPAQSVKDFLEWTLQRGDRVLVWDKKYETPIERIFLAKIDGAEVPFVCVTSSSESNFYSGQPFHTCSWRNCKPTTQLKITIDGKEVTKKEALKILQS